MSEGSQDWVAAGFDALAEGGVDLVRVEVLAQRLGVTKGGFYRRFRDRPALLEAILARWVEGRLEAIQRQTELAGAAPAERLKALMQLFSTRVNAQGLAIELAIRQWARRDPKAAAAAAQVDAVRLARVTELYAQLGVPPAEAEARAFVFYAFLFGQELMETPPEKREALLETCAAALVAV